MELEVEEDAQTEVVHRPDGPRPLGREELVANLDRGEMGREPPGQIAGLGQRWNIERKDHTARGGHRIFSRQRIRGRARSAIEQVGDRKKRGV